MSGFNLAKSFKDKFCAFVERRGKAAELAEKTGISPSAISEYKNSPRLPTLDHVQLIAKGMGISVAELLGINAQEPIIRTAPVKDEDIIELFLRGATFSQPKKALITKVLKLNDLRARALLETLETALPSDIDESESDSG